MSERRGKKKSKKKAVIAGVVALALLGAIGASRLLGGGGTADGPAMDDMGAMMPQEAIASRGPISSTIEGSGRLQAGETTYVTVPVGIEIDKIKVAKGDVVTTGQELASVDIASVASALLDARESAKALREKIKNIKGNKNDPMSNAYLENIKYSSQLSSIEMAEAMLTRLMQDPVIKATANGTINAINITEGGTVTQTGAPGEESQDAQGSLKLDALSANLVAQQRVSVPPEGDEPETIADRTAIKTDTDPEKNPQLKIKVAPPETDDTPETSLQLTKRESQMYEVKEVKWTPQDEVFRAQTLYTATITLTAKEGFCFSDEVTPVVEGSKSLRWEIREGDTKASEGDTLILEAKYAKTAGETAPSGETDEGAGDGETSDLPTDGGADSGFDGGYDTGFDAGSVDVGGGASAGGDTAGTTSDAQVSYDAFNATAFSIASNDVLSVSINVDELDIAMIEEGQSADITIEAMPDRTYKGKISKITSGNGDENEGSGNTKYPVKITIDKTEEMRIGMSTSVTIYLDEVEDAVLIPINAIQEEGTETFVYTEPGESGILGGRRDIKTGLSNSEMVQVVSGLEEGETVYYFQTSIMMEDEEMMEEGEIVY